MSCSRKRQKQGNQAKAGSKGASETRERSLSRREVLERFHRGPDEGIFTDGSCQGNPGPGGWGAVWVKDGQVMEERHGYEASTTNNRMELRAIIEGLSMVGENEETKLYTDSRLAVDTLTKWAEGWEKRGWRRKDGEVKNLELVQQAYSLKKKRPGVHITWIRAHDGSRWNEYADALSTAHLREEL
jgi:ribonuclease HI